MLNYFGILGIVSPETILGKTVEKEVATVPDSRCSLVVVDGR